MRVIDLHCDTITECQKRALNLADNDLHFDLDRIPEDTRWCQCMAIFMPDELRGDEAIAYFERMYKCFAAQMSLYSGRLARVNDVSAIDSALDSGHAAILTVEGGSALAGRLERVEKLYDLGVRMMTLTWNGANEICGGVAGGEGFSPFGRSVIRKMEALGMTVDVSHISDRGFWELCEFAEKPFIASHSNSRTVCGHPRNLTDDSFREITRRGGVVGLNYYDKFIRDDGGSEKLEDIIRHIHHFLELGGEDTLALGSDYDGADLPPYLNGIKRATEFFDAIERSGVSGSVLDKIIYQNARRFFAAVSKGR